MKIIFYSLFLYLQGIKDSIDQIFNKDSKPSGHSGGLLSPLLETLRAGHAAKWIEGKDVLDCGCGRSRILNMLGSAVNYTGIDNDVVLINYLKKSFPQAHFICKNMETLEFPQQSIFDSMIMTALIEHLNSPATFISHMMRYLRPNGILVITTPAPFWEPIYHLGCKIGIFDYNADEDHETLQTKTDIESILKKSGLSLEKYYRFALGGNQLAVGRKVE